jgi:hypothetical protein
MNYSIKKIWISIDENTDSIGRSIGNVRGKYLSGIPDYFPNGYSSGI